MMALAIVKVLEGEGPAKSARDWYGALVNVPVQVQELTQTVAEVAGWELGTQSGGGRSLRSRTFEARNMSVYGYSLGDEPLAVVQIRRYFYSRYGGSVRKSYVLGGDDRGQIFAHILPSSPLQWHGLSTATPEDTVTWAESKIFQVPMDRVGSIIRQGDIGIIPMQAIPGRARQLDPDQALHMWEFANSHTVTVDGEIWDHPSGLYAKGLVEIVHQRDQHHPIDFQGTCRIVIGREGANPWWMDVALGD